MKEKIQLLQKWFKSGEIQPGNNRSWDDVATLLNQIEIGLSSPSSGGEEAQLTGEFKINYHKDGDAIIRIYNNKGHVFCMYPYHLKIEAEAHLNLLNSKPIIVPSHKLDEEIAKAAEKYGEENKQVIAHGIYSTAGDRALGFIAGVEWHKSYVAPPADLLQQEKINDWDNFMEWAHRKDWRFNAWNDRKWHNRANSHFDTTPTQELYLIFKEETN